MSGAYDTYNKFTSMLADIEDTDGPARIEAVERFAEKHKGHVRLVPVDDRVHTSSCLVLIGHKDGSRRQGTSVFYIPQWIGRDVEFYLYPRHRADLIKSLQAVGCNDEQDG